MPKLLAHAVSRWSEDPFSRGAWTTLNRVGTPETRATLGAPLSDRLILAGEATHPEAPAMVHGAWLAGRDAADWAAAKGHKRVAVIGAGFAGIGAAARFLEHGLAPVVLEARERLGGRVWSRPLGDVVVESGANWLQQGAANPLRPLAEAAGLPGHDTDFTAPLDVGPDHAVRAIGAPGLSQAMWRSLDLASPDMILSEWRRGWLQSLGAPGPEAIDRIIAAEIELESGLPLEDMTVMGVSEPGVGEGDVWLPQGLGALLDRLAQGCDIRMGQDVRAIRSRPDAVEVAGPWGALAADAVIVTVPVGVLQSGTITFDPPLPARHRAALKGLTAGVVEKASLRFDRRFWPRTASGYLRIHGPEAGQVSEWLDMSDAVGAPVLTGIFANAWARQLWHGTDAEIAGRVAEIVRRYARP